MTKPLREITELAELGNLFQSLGTPCLLNFAASPKPAETHIFILFFNDLFVFIHGMQFAIDSVVKTSLREKWWR